MIANAGRVLMMHLCGSSLSAVSRARRGSHHGQSQLPGLLRSIETGLERVDTLLLGLHFITQVCCQAREQQLYSVVIRSSMAVTSGLSAMAVLPSGG
jgi:hypothetical protein